MTPKSISNSKAFTIVESFIVLGILFVLTTVLVALFLHDHEDESPPESIESPPAVAPGYRLKSSDKGSQ